MEEEKINTGFPRSGERNSLTAHPTDLWGICYFPIRYLCVVVSDHRSRGQSGNTMLRGVIH